MSLGKIVASIEIIVTVWGSLKLAESLGQFRWENRIAKVIFYLAVIFRIGLGIINLQWSKFSDIGVVVFSFYLLIIYIIFYHIDSMKIMILHSLYWFSIMIFQMACLFVTTYAHSLVLKDYIYDSGNAVYPYYGIHIVGLCLEIAVVCLIGRFVKYKKVLLDFDVWFYVGCVPIIICEIFIDYFFLGGVVFKRVDSFILFLELFLVWTLISGYFIMISYVRYVQMRHRWNKIDMNMKMLSTQYEFMLRSYEEKRCQVHDNVQHDIMLLGMIENRQYEEAIIYLQEKRKREESTQNRYTGLTTIDIMLNYKVIKAKEHRIRFDVSAEIYHYTLDDKDLCVMLGNLLDNSIDAVQDLPEQQRWIKIIFKSPNDIFMVEIINPYEGVRKKRQGNYLTTKKENRQMHGIGLRSVEKIVLGYGGDMEISDKDNIFKVMITIYKDVNKMKEGEKDG